MRRNHIAGGEAVARHREADIERSARAAIEAKLAHGQNGHRRGAHRHGRGRAGALAAADGHVQGVGARVGRRGVGNGGVLLVGGEAPRAGPEVKGGPGHRGGRELQAAVVGHRRIAARCSRGLDGNVQVIAVVGGAGDDRVRTHQPDAVARARGRAGRQGGQYRAVALPDKCRRANSSGRGKRAAGIRELGRNGIAGGEAVARHRKADVERRARAAGEAELAHGQHRHGIRLHQHPHAGGVLAAGAVAHVHVVFAALGGLGVGQVQGLARAHEAAAAAGVVHVPGVTALARRLGRELNGAVEHHRRVAGGRGRRRGVNGQIGAVISTRDGGVGGHHAHPVAAAGRRAKRHRVAQNAAAGVRADERAVQPRAGREHAAGIRKLKPEHVARAVAGRVGRERHLDERAAAKRRGRYRARGNAGRVREAARRAGRTGRRGHANRAGGAAHRGRHREAGAGVARDGARAGGHAVKRHGRGPAQVGARQGYARAGPAARGREAGDARAGAVEVIGSHATHDGVLPAGALEHQPQHPHARGRRGQRAHHRVRAVGVERGRVSIDGGIGAGQGGGRLNLKREVGGRGRVGELHPHLADGLGRAQISLNQGRVVHVNRVAGSRRGGVGVESQLGRVAHRAANGVAAGWQPGREVSRRGAAVLHEGFVAHQAPLAIGIARAEEDAVRAIHQGAGIGHEAEVGQILGWRGHRHVGGAAKAGVGIEVKLDFGDVGRGGQHRLVVKAAHVGEAPLAVGVAAAHAQGVEPGRQRRQRHRQRHPADVGGGRYGHVGGTPEAGVGVDEVLHLGHVRQGVERGRLVVKRALVGEAPLAVGVAAAQPQLVEARRQRTDVHVEDNAADVGSGRHGHINGRPKAGVGIEEILDFGHVGQGAERGRLVVKGAAVGQAPSAVGIAGAHAQLVEPGREAAQAHAEGHAAEVGSGRYGHVGSTAGAGVGIDEILDFGDVGQGAERGRLVVERAAAGEAPLPVRVLRAHAQGVEAAAEAAEAHRGGEAGLVGGRRTGQHEGRGRAQAGVGVEEVLGAGDGGLAVAAECAAHEQQHQ